MNKLRIKKLGVLSVAKIYAVMMLVIMLIFSIPYGLFIMIFGAALMGGGQRENLLAGGGGIVLGLLIMIGLPIIYSVFGFIAGALSAFVYNIFSGLVGGIEIEVENIH